MAEYRLSPAAERDLEEIWRYTSKQWGLRQAGRYIDTLLAAFATLAETPHGAPACDYIRPGYRRRGVERHVIYFVEAPYGITVVRVLHERMDSGLYL